jgi:hypothetical protein
MISSFLFWQLVRSDVRELPNELRRLAATNPQTIVATAISSNHFEEASALAEGLFLNVGLETPFVIYDLGLLSSERAAIATWPGQVYLVRFRFEKHAKFVSTLWAYAWKVEVLAELASLKPELLLWSDASGRVLETVNLALLRQHLHGSRLNVAFPGGWSKTNDYTHPMMFKYMNLSHLDYANCSQWEATGVAVAPKHPAVQWIMEKCVHTGRCFT